MSNPTDEHPGHALLEILELPPEEAIQRWRDQVLADLNSRQATGVLIKGGFIGSDLQDQGIDAILDLLTLAIASVTDTILADNNGNERSRPIDQILEEQIEDTRRFLDGQVELRLRERYLPTLMTLEIERRKVDDEEA